MKMIKANIANNAKEFSRLQLALQKAKDVRDEAAAMTVLRAAAQNKRGLDDIIEEPPATEGGFNNPIVIGEDGEGELEVGEAHVVASKTLRRYESVFSDGPAKIVNPMSLIGDD